MAHGVDGVWPEGDSSPKEKKVKTLREGKGAGSRRIFSPQFKLQVLDSYRRDKDCRGNQRATARKYGIHRRQIQKWLQMESTLRCNAGSALNLARQRDDARPEASPPHQEPPDLIDVDKISDSEDEASSDASLYDQDQALDFTCAALSKRRFFTVSFKLEVLEAFRSDPACRGNQRATARKFGIHRRQVQKWLDHETQLRCEPPVDPECAECCLDLSKKRRLETELPVEEVIQPLAVVPPGSPASSQDQALCLVKAPETPPDLYRPYNLSSSPPSNPPYEPCHWSTPYYPYYGVVHANYLSPWMPPAPDVHYYKQPIPSFNLYTPMYSS